MRSIFLFVKSEKGAVLLISMVVLLGVAVFGLGMLLNNQLSSTVAFNYKKRIQSFYAADGLVTKVAQEIADTNQYKYLKMTGTDIGSPAIAGTDSSLKNNVTLWSSGSDVWNTSDQLHFVYVKMSGDLDICVEIDSIHNSGEWGKSGLMIRADTSAGSVNVFMAMTRIHGAQFQYRTTSGASTSSQPNLAGATPYWVRIKRSGDTITGYSGAAKGGWDSVGTIVDPMANPICVGIAVTSCTTSVLASSTVTGLSGVALADSTLDSTFGAFKVKYSINEKSNGDVNLACLSYTMAGTDSTFTTNLQQAFVASTGIFYGDVPDSIYLPIVLYDYHADGSNPDFQQQDGWAAPQPYRDMVQRKIGPNRKPLLNTTCDPTWRNQVLSLYAAYPDEEASWGVKRSGAVPRQECWAGGWLTDTAGQPYLCWGSKLDSLYNISHPTVCWWWNDHINQWFWPNRGGGAVFDPATCTYSGLVPNVLDPSGWATAAGNANMSDSMANIVFYDSLLFFQRPVASGYYVFPADGWADARQFLVCTCANPDLEWNDFNHGADAKYIHCVPSPTGYGAHRVFSNPSSGVRGNFMPLSNKGFKNDCPEIDTSDTCWHRTNFSFGVEFHKQFVYKPGQVFSFDGDDDTWIFIADSLVVDLGGVHSPIAGTANLDLLAPKLHMVVGNTYWLDFFNCERMSPGSDIKITTNMFSYASVPTQRYWKRNYGNLN